MFSIGEILPDRDVVAQGEPVNITATFAIVGSTNEPHPNVTWESDLGTFESTNQVSTIWTAPSDFLGDVKIKLTATFMGHTDIAERAIRIVKTPAGSWGSLSGYLASTGEVDTTDNQGYFYLDYIPQGSNGLEFHNIPYSWAIELSQQITITGGNHEHLGNILFYTSTPAEISSYQVLPERQAILSIVHSNVNLIDFHELYQANDVNGSGAQLIRTIESDLAELTIQDQGGNAIYALKSVPLNGQASSYSDWTQIPFIDVVDPDAEGSFFTYNNFFSATLNWQPTGYDQQDTKVITKDIRLREIQLVVGFMFPLCWELMFKVTLSLLNQDNREIIT